MNKQLVFAFLYVVLFIVAIVQTLGTFNTLNSTGIVKINSQPSASIYLSAENYEQQLIGTYKATVRLSVGYYTLTVNGAGKTSSQTIYVKAKQTLAVSLIPTQVVSDPFTNISESTQIEANSIIKLLPYIGPGFRYSINYKFTGQQNSQLELIIAAPNPSGWAQATAWLKGLGYNLSGINIHEVNSQVNY